MLLPRCVPSKEKPAPELVNLLPFTTMLTPLITTDCSGTEATPTKTPGVRRIVEWS
jgi:hypothetical protein